MPDLNERVGDGQGGKGRRVRTVWETSKRKNPKDRRPEGKTVMRGRPRGQR
jgi:hypothetical protein